MRRVRQRHRAPRKRKGIRGARSAGTRVMARSRVQQRLQKHGGPTLRFGNTKRALTAAANIHLVNGTFDEPGPRPPMPKWGR